MAQQIRERSRSPLRRGKCWWVYVKGVSGAMLIYESELGGNKNVDDCLLAAAERAKLPLSYGNLNMHETSEAATPLKRATPMSRVASGQSEERPLIISYDSSAIPAEEKLLKVTGEYWSTWKDVQVGSMIAFRIPERWRGEFPAIPRADAVQFFSKWTGEGSSARPSSSRHRVQDRCNVLGGKGGQIAHILPHSLSCAEVWQPALTTLFPDDPKRNSGVPFTKLVQGSTVRNLERYCLRHVKWNKMCCLNEAELFDNQRAIGLIPCMDMESMLGWRGQAYDAILVANEADSYHKVQIAAEQKRATEQQVADALKGLCRLLRHLASKSVSDQVSRAATCVDAKSDSIAMCLAFHRSVTSHAAKGEVVVPKCTGGLKFPLVRFQQTVWEWATECNFTVVPHHAPHPLFLMLRACNFHVHHLSGRKHLVLPACPPPSSGTSDSEDVGAIPRLRELRHWWAKHSTSAGAADIEDLRRLFAK
ncbi:unnamed protein product [Symbiodinium sp. CCMP2592]|nr:unnamed protein product [Symbiodinium sp. CCMP2592]